MDSAIRAARTEEELVAAGERISFLEAEVARWRKESRDWQIKYEVAAEPSSLLVLRRREALHVADILRPHFEKQPEAKTLNRNGEMVVKIPARDFVEVRDFMRLWDA